MKRISFRVTCICFVGICNLVAVLQTVKPGKWTKTGSIVYQFVVLHWFEYIYISFYAQQYYVSSIIDPTFATVQLFVRVMTHVFALHCADSLRNGRNKLRIAILFRVYHHQMICITDRMEKYPVQPNSDILYRNIIEIVSLSNMKVHFQWHIFRHI